MNRHSDTVRWKLIPSAVESVLRHEDGLIQENELTDHGRPYVIEEFFERLKELQQQ